MASVSLNKKINLTIEVDGKTTQKSAVIRSKSHEAFGLTSPKRVQLKITRATTPSAAASHPMPSTPSSEGSLSGSGKSLKESVRGFLFPTKVDKDDKPLFTVRDEDTEDRTTFVANFAKAVTTFGRDFAKNVSTNTSRNMIVAQEISDLYLGEIPRGILGLDAGVCHDIQEKIGKQEITAKLFDEALTQAQSGM